MIISARSKRLFEATGFRNEKELQDAIERLPSLLDVISRLNGQDLSLFILKREFGVSSGSIDFLAVDVDGSLYIIETKLAQNPELRRTIIGQVLEYASNLSDMSYDAIAVQCSKYLKGQGPLERVIHSHYAAQSEGEPPLSASEYKMAMADNLRDGRLNIVIIANEVGLEIQRLLHFVDQATGDDLNFIVLEINRYDLDSDEVFHTGIVWAAKYIRSLFSKSLVDEETYITSKSPHVQMLIRHLDVMCQAKGLSKTANTRGLSWKHMSGGSIFISGDTLSTNWSTLREKSEEMDAFKEYVMKMAKEAGFAIVRTKHGVICLDLGDSTRVEDADQFVDLAYEVLEKSDVLARRASPTITDGPVLDTADVSSGPRLG